MSNDEDRARKAFGKFLKVHKLTGRAISKAAGLSPAAASQFIRGNSRSPKRETLNKLASGASEKLGRTITVSEMLGEAPASAEAPVRSYVGAGDEIFPIEEDAPFDYVPAPPGMEDAEATLVRGNSMHPLYHDGDLLFHRRMEIDPRLLRDEIAVAQVKGGKRFVKLILPGTKRGRFHLVSINPSHPPIEDQVLIWVAPIVWVKKRDRRL